MEAGNNISVEQLEAKPALKSTGRGKMKRGKLWIVKLGLLAIAVVLAIIDSRLTGSHRARNFNLFRKPALAYSVFTFGVSFWGFVLALPFALIPFKKLSYKHRYILVAFGIMIALLLTYLVIFLFRMKR